MRPATKARLKELGYTSYTAYLRSPHWSAKRQEYIAAGLPWACYVCGTDVNIMLHHCDYSRVGAENVRTDLVPLCKRHHRGCHSYMKAHRVRVEAAHVNYKMWLDSGRPKKKQRPDQRRKRRR